MDSKERKRRIQDLDALARSHPELAWWAMDMIRILSDVVDDLEDLGASVADLEEHQINQQKMINGLRDKYSEVLYKLQSGE